MSNFLSYRSISKKMPNKIEIENGLNQAGNFSVSTFEENNNLFSTAFLDSAPVKGNRNFRNERWVVIFAGDLIDYETVPFTFLINTAEKKEWEKLEELNGVFAISFFDKVEKRFYLVSDRRSQHPVYYFVDKEEIIFSTELSLFVKILNEPEFNEKWLYDYLFFSFTVDETTFLKNVSKLPPASILECDITNNEYRVDKYAPVFEVRNPLLKGHEALEYACEIFKKQVPKYYPESSEIACALTNGWDGRTVLALAPDHNQVTAYTYGEANCVDINGAKRTTQSLNIKHKEINFDSEFLNQLPNYIFETVYLSSGLQGILRSSLLHVYKTLSINCNFNLALSGILLDGLFRGHGGYPGVISKELYNLFKNGSLDFDNQWDFIFEENVKSFKNEIQDKSTYLINNYGEITSSKHHLNYEVFMSGPGHFGGEWKIASNYLTQRVLAWDNEITKIAYSIQQSKLTFSQFNSPKFGSRETMILQSYILRKLSPKFSKIPFKFTKPTIVLTNDHVYKTYTFYRKGYEKLIKTLTRKQIGHLENWNSWINNNLRSQTDDLIFTKDALIRNYISSKFLQKLYAERQFAWIGKLVTVEIILRLIKSKWQRFW